ncbi:MAG: pilus assembly FimT family protein [Gemmatimonadota bacterium]
MRQNHNQTAKTRNNCKTPPGRRGGFTLIELMIVLVIGAIGMSFAVPSFTRMTQTKNAQNARDNLVWMGMRARARAIERGQVWQLQIDPGTAKARVIQRGAASATDSVVFSSEFGATVSTAGNAAITLCYSPRGYAFSCAVSSPTTDVDVTFTHNDKTAVARVRPLGQIERI